MRVATAGWAWAADYAYAARRQLRRVFSRAGLPVGDGGRAPVVLLPGVYETWHFLEPVARELARGGYRVSTVPGLGDNRRPVADAAGRVARYLEEQDLRDVVLVAHSKGGLVGKQVMVSGSGHRVAGMVAIATPFRGSRWARYVVGRTLRAFAPGDPVLRALALELDVDRRITAVYPQFDPHIPETGSLPGARNVELPLAGHFSPLGTRLLVRTVVDEVARLERQD
ncbi:esterase/lipase family protein [Oerskovia flava]|uniref:esterase/lipase family protein n=1 Tax=Oerskovia flava TaxID=2986422 RepID=UPI00224030B3|nr:alpha/beta hydrolase [Oerskovia sp. JB1-3-2]